MNVTILVVTDTGCEEACQLEIARYTKTKSHAQKNIVVLQGPLALAAVLGYHLQVARRVLVQLVEPIVLERLDEAKADDRLLEAVFPKEHTFKAEADVLARTLEGIDANAPLSQEVVEAVGGWVYRLGRKVNLSKPDVIVHGIAIDGKIFIGIDVVGAPLAKREYRIMLSRRSLKATIAAATVLYAGAKERDVILDPLADDGSLAIEAALLLSKTSPRHFSRSFAFQKFPALKGTNWTTWKTEQDEHQDAEKITAYCISLQDMKSVRTNAKLAGVEKQIHATKVTVEWVETKAGEDGVDRIITAPMYSGKSIDEKRTQKVLDELFYQAEFVLKKNKTITCITEKPHELEAPAKKYGFEQTAQHDVLMGMRKMSIVTYINKKLPKKD